MLNIKKQYITLSHGEVRVYSLSGNTKINTSSPSILIVPGWGESARAAITLAEDLYTSGNKVYIIEYGNLNNPKKVATCGISKHFPITERARACAIIDFIDSQDEKINIVAHSQGAIASILSASSNHKKIGSILLISPAGIVLLSLHKLIYRYIKSFIMQLTNAFKTGDSRGKSYFSEVSQYIGDNPLQLGRDAYGIADTDIVPLLKQLQKKGVEVHIIGVKHDQIFPIDKMRDRVKSLYPIYSIEGAHNSIYINTEPFIEYINKILKN